MPTKNDKSDQTVPQNAELEAAELRKTLAEAKLKELELDEKRLELREAKRKDEWNDYRYKQEYADDEYQRGVYPFVYSVRSDTVYACKQYLSSFHQLFPGEDILIDFNSPGGSVLDGFELYDAIRRASDLGHHVTTRISGVAASMAGVLVQAGDTRIIGRTSFLHAHEVSSGAIGKASDMMDEATLARRLTDKMVTIYAEKSGGKVTEKKFRAMIERKELWLDAEEALGYGFVDEID